MTKGISLLAAIAISSIFSVGAFAAQNNATDSTPVGQMYLVTDAEYSAITNETQSYGVSGNAAQHRDLIAYIRLEERTVGPLNFSPTRKNLVRDGNVLVSGY